MIEQLCLIVESARDYAILGFYPESITLYEQSVSLINSISASDTSAEDHQIIKWDNIKNNLIKECTTVKKAQLSLRRFKPLVKTQNLPTFVGTVDANNYEIGNLINNAEKVQRNTNKQEDLVFNDYLDSILPLKKRISYRESISDTLSLDEILIRQIEECIIDSSNKFCLDDVIGLDDAKEFLYETIVLPSLMPELHTRRPNKGILIYGPPGCGKSMLVSEASKMGGGTFFNICSSALISKWKGGSKKLVKLLFDIARFYAPSIICFDDFEYINKVTNQQFKLYRKLQNAILKQIHNVFESEHSSKTINIIFITNTPWEINHNFISLIEKKIYLPLPNEVNRRKLFEVFLANSLLSVDIDWDYLVFKSQNFITSNILTVCRDAMMIPAREIYKEIESQGKSIESIKEDDLRISMEDFRKAFSASRYTGENKRDIEKYENWSSK